MPSTAKKPLKRKKWQQQNKKLEQHQEKRLRKQQKKQVLDPDAGPDNLPSDVLQNLIRAAQKHSVGNWHAFIKTAAPEQKKSDPSLHTEQVLRGFVKSLLEGPSRDAAQPVTDKKSTVNPAVFVQRYVKWTRQVQKEHTQKATSVLPFSVAKTLDSNDATPSTTASPAAALSAAGTKRAKAATSAAAKAAAKGSASGPEKLTSAWGLVHASRNHPKYRMLYSLPSYLPGWARTKRRAIGAGSKDVGSGAQERAEARGLRPRLLALDCEMCETDREQATLVGLCVSDEEGKVLYKALVRPRGNIVDLRTELTGITPQDLETKPTVTRSQARKAVKALLLESWRAHKQPTILVGHALHHDLLALRLDHQPVIDTSLIFAYKGLPACTPGLRDLSRAVLQEDMPARGQGRHDSAEDAAVAMRLVVHELEQQHRTPPMAPPDIKVDKEQLSKLLVHSIPSNTTEQEVLDLFARKPSLATIAAGSRPGKPACGKQDSSDNDTSSSESNSSSTCDSSGDSSSRDEADEQPRKKRQLASPHQGTPKQQAKAAAAGPSPHKHSRASSSSDSSNSESSEGSNEDEGDKGGTAALVQGKGKQGPGGQAASASAGGGADGAEAPPKPIGFEGKGIENRRAVLLFRSPAEANAAFSSLVGASSIDSNGRNTKEVPLPGPLARSVKVRRMAAHNGLLFQVPKQARRPRPQNVPAKLMLGGEGGQLLTKRDKYRQRELLKKGKQPEDLLAAQIKDMKAKARRAKKKERKAVAKEG